jgi:hypothetical protein
MSTAVPTQPTADTRTRPTTRPRAHRERPVRPISFARVTGVELRKMFDTRSGFWLLASVFITAALATGAIVLFAPDSALTYGSFAAAIGFPMTVILPVIALLSVTSEWSQRSGLTTFSLVPHRGRVVAAKLVCAVGVGVASMAVAMVVGAVGNLVGTAITGTPLVWDMSTTELALIVLGNVLNMLIGFTLGVLVRNSAGAIVAYFVYSFVLSSLSVLLAANQEWYRHLQPWVDFNFAQGALFDGPLTGEQWANLAVAGVPWLVLPLGVGLWLLRRSEVK